MSERHRFITDARRRIASFAELCTHYGISRKTGYKWLGRAEADGSAHLTEQSRRPRTCPHATPERLVTRLLEARRRHPRWGPRKLLKVLRRRDRREGRREPWPARSTVADLFRRHGLIIPRRRRCFPGHPGRPLTPMTAPNVIWTADFKGQFRTTDGIYCYPLTVQDGFSRYLLACRGLAGTTGAESRPIFERLFREYGLPEILRTDNGVPFRRPAPALPTQCLVDPARHLPRAHRARASGAEWPP